MVITIHIKQSWHYCVPGPVTCTLTFEIFGQNQINLVPHFEQNPASGKCDVPHLEQNSPALWWLGFCPGSDLPFPFFSLEDRLRCSFSPELELSLAESPDLEESESLEEDRFRLEPCRLRSLLRAKRSPRILDICSNPSRKVFTGCSAAAFEIEPTAFSVPHLTNLPLIASNASVAANLLAAVFI